MFLSLSRSLPPPLPPSLVLLPTKGASQLLPDPPEPRLCPESWLSKLTSELEALAQGDDSMDPTPRSEDVDDEDDDAMALVTSRMTSFPSWSVVSQRVSEMGVHTLGKSGTRRPRSVTLTLNLALWVKGRGGTTGEVRLVMEVEEGGDGRDGSDRVTSLPPSSPLFKASCTSKWICACTVNRQKPSFSTSGSSPSTSV
jgi:hypothetical protein